MVMTNAHVVAGSTDTVVQDVNGDELPATVIHFDPNVDLAVLAETGFAARFLSLIRPRATKASSWDSPVAAHLTRLHSRSLNAFVRLAMTSTTRNESSATC